MLTFVLLFVNLSVFVSIATGYELLYSFTTQELSHFRNQTKDAFYYAFYSYMSHGFPYDEVKPISCEPRRLEDRSRGDLDDILGDIMLTLIDSLDALIIMNDKDGFYRSIDLMLSHNLTFEKDVGVSVFEMNIRVIGGLVSAHQLATYLYDDYQVKYGDVLLRYAIDMGNRLLPAFSTRSSIPIHRINLLTGMIPNEKLVTCTAAGSTYLVEMSMLSRLTNNTVYEKVARKALNNVWNRRSPNNLVGSLIDVKSGRWKQHHTGIGAGVDSFFETILKSAILTGDGGLHEIFEMAYSAAQEHLQRNHLHKEVSMYLGKNQVHSNVVSSLQAFWPALQVLKGDIDDARKTFNRLHKIWKKYRSLPDMYNAGVNQLYPEYGRNYPLRPEMIESAYYLYQATRDTKYIQFAKEFLKFLLENCKVSCGFASVADVSTRRLDDRMDTYFFSETLKYLYLLFDAALGPNQRDSVFCASSNSKGNSIDKKRCLQLDSILFSTEGHVFILDKSIRSQKYKTAKNMMRGGMCPQVDFVSSLGFV